MYDVGLGRRRETRKCKTAGYCLNIGECTELVERMYVPLREGSVFYLTIDFCYLLLVHRRACECSGERFRGNAMN
jgi:hypothetical protein